MFFNSIKDRHCYGKLRKFNVISERGVYYLPDTFPSADRKFLCNLFQGRPREISESIEIEKNIKVSTLFSALFGDSFNQPIVKLLFYLHYALP